MTHLSFGPDKLENLHNHLKEVHPVHNQEEDNHLPFLDVLITKEGNRMNTSIYRKATL